jgi:uncharacterized delta-60 repeat protein
MLYKFILIFCAALSAVCAQINVLAADGETDAFFLTGNGFDDDVRDIALQSDGKLIVAGEFINIAGVPRRKIARLDASGNLDPTFNPGNGANGNIFVVKVLPDNKILIAGEFTTYNGAAVNRIARLNADGSLDTSFNTGTGASFTVNAIAVQTDGKIIVAGNFDTFNSINNFGIVRLNGDGGIDQTFHTPLDNTAPFSVNSAALQADGKILIGGSFFNSTGTIRRIARLETNGNFDSSFQTGTGANGTVNAITVQLDGSILIGGSFSAINGTTKPNLARLTANGTLDNAFTPPNLGTPLKIVLQTDGKILICGGTSFLLKRLNADGSTDNSFTESEFGLSMYAVAVTPDNKIIGGGSFPRVAGVGGAGPAGVRKFNIDGTRDNSYVTRTGGAEFYVTKLKIQQDGKILIVGEFSAVGGLERPRIARLNPDGTVDQIFSPTVNANAAASQADGKVIIAERFRIGENFRLLRLNNDGTIDSTFTANTGTSVTGNPNVNDIIVQPDGKILVSGGFETVNGAARTGIVRLNSDGSLDASFNPNIFSPGTIADITGLALMPNGQMMVGGRFQNTINTGYAIFRLNSSGASDSTYNFSSVNNFIKEIVVQTDGKVLVSGGFTQINAIAVKALARINADGSIDASFAFPQIDFPFVSTMLPLANNKILIGGEFTTIGGVSRPRLARINADGSLDTSYNVTVNGTNSPEVNAIKQQADGNIVIGGDFGGVNGFQRLYTARLLNSPKSAFADFDGDGKTDLSIFRPTAGEWWYLKSSGGNAAFQFGAASDKLTPADFTGDGKTDVALFRPSTGEWFILRSEDQSFYSFPFGANGDIPFVGDFDADGRADNGVFRPSTATWFIRRSSDGASIIQQFGQTGDVPVVADYDGDGKSDIAIYRVSAGEWWINRSTAGLIAFQFGNSSDKPVQGDYTGDGKTDVALFRPSTGEWFVLRSENQSYYSFPFGANGDIPAPGDYDGDGKFDATVFRPSTTTWYSQRTTAGTLIQAFGQSGDIPVPSAFVP